MPYLIYTVLLALIMTLYPSYQDGRSVWGSLAMVTKEKVYDESMGFEVDKVTVGPVPRMMDGQEIEVKGYMIPLEGRIKQSHFMFSAYPANMCFFCGMAGPETAMQVFMADDKKLTFSDNKITLKGTLRINEDDLSGMLYTLDQAKKI